MAHRVILLPPGNWVGFWSEADIGSSFMSSRCYNRADRKENPELLVVTDAQRTSLFGSE